MDSSWVFIPTNSNGKLITLPRLIFSGQTAPMAPLPWESIRHCLRGRRIAFMGDSLTRYQYLNLVHFIARGSWYSEPPTLENERSWPSWAEFYKGTSARLTTSTSHESCDCFRPEDNNVGRSIENRVFEIASLGLAIAFFQMFEGIPSRGIEPSNLTMKDCRRDLGCVQGGCQPGSCSNPSWSASGPIELTEHISNAFRPDTVIMNSGLWGEESSFATPARIRDLHTISQHMRSAGAKELIWKTTTALPFDGVQPAHAELEILLPALAKQDPPWRIFDAHSITDSLATGVLRGQISRDAVFWAGGHFQPEVYRGLNEALLVDILRGCELCDGKL